MTDLKPCRCGAKAKVNELRRGNYRRVGDNYQVVCNRCRARGPLIQNSHAEAAAAWNRFVGDHPTASDDRRGGYGAASTAAECAKSPRKTSVWKPDLTPDQQARVDDLDQEIGERIAARQEGEPEAVAWHEIDPMIDPKHHAAMIVCRHHSSGSYGPALAFCDVGGTWRVAGSPAGMAPLAWMPTHCAPAPSIWTALNQSPDSKGDA